MLKLESAHDTGNPVPLHCSVAIHNPELPYTTRNCSHATTLRAHTIENGATRAQSHARTDDSASRARDPGDPVESLCEGLTQAFERACCHAQIQRSPALLILIPAWLSENPPPNRLCGNKLRPILVICTTALFLCFVFITFPEKDNHIVGVGRPYRSRCPARRSLSTGRAWGWTLQAAGAVLLCLH